jgi:hypothetical protein
MTRNGAWNSFFPGIAALFLLAVVGHQIIEAGAWLDEFWQYWISGAQTIHELFGRLAGDPHPPFFNIAARGVIVLAGENFVTARLLSTGLALVTLTIGLVALARSEADDVNMRVYSAFWLFVVGMAGPVGLIELAASFRSYPWIIALAALQTALLFRVLDRESVSFSPIAAGAITYCAIVLHYVGAIPAIAIAVVSAFAAWQSGSLRHAKVFLAAATLGALTLFATVLWQMPHWATTMDFNWIESTGVTGVSQLLDTLWQYVTFNPFPIALILLGISRGAYNRRTMLVFAPIPLAIVVVLIVDAITPVLNGRYLIAILIVFALAAALALRRVPSSGLLWPAMAVAVMAQAGLHVWLRPPIAGWDAAAQKVAGIVSTCPGTRVYSASHWLFTAGSDSGVARRESQVVRFGHEMMGRRYGYSPLFLTGNTQVLMSPGPCPTLLVIEHAGGLAQIGADSILKKAGLALPSGAQVRMFDFRNGVLIRIDARN